MATGVFFHAHPDDEAIATGGTMAKAKAAGHRLVLVVATRGELGEPVDGVLADGEELWQRRVDETQRAAAVLGVDRVVFLGYRDSGMMGEPTNDDPRSFWQADLATAAGKLAAVLREEQADVLVIYDDHGGYGHPDHIQAHRIAMAAAERSGVPDKLYYTAIPREGVRQMIQTLRDSGVDIGFDPPEDFGTPDELITSMLDVSAHTEAKRKALQAHASQAENIFLLRMPEEVQQAAFSFEAFVRRFSRVEAPAKEDDLFAGLR